MACSVKSGFCVSGSNEIDLKTKRVVGFCPSVGNLQFTESKSSDLPVLKSQFKGTQVIVSDPWSFGDWSVKGPANFSVHAQSSICVSRTLRWWDKILKPNMIDINSAEELVDSLLNAGDRLVIIDFYSPGCGGCKALHPKICQFAELNPNALFLKVNQEELKTMCNSLNVHVLPFFRFYRGAEGRLCSFSCTNATIKKFKDALGKHGTDRCSLEPARGLEESELLKLASNGQISTDLPSRSTVEETVEKLILNNMKISNTSSVTGDKIEEIKKENTVLVM
ncbi:hypothetical protein HHK36_007267 [Tetracentron sinense]|uniref:Thioredoxin domain-containing protein n=1 Tax=Tetracentron sinense TaxID=13715 RepID=A0A835DPS6_TETSI|nr:hypothetical protein HHK36_007267 [Tetracentron sinense]